ncbi:host-nuclease inhibitor Gam family protein [Cronobacter malonaticus]|uniref:host-nuclease inhibitor Gam family protein n=1 Tax=Cronobacter malonaticus TaxID=413503 RepID=UPI002895E1FD|nr:host-nuclease inhibitor Gam family protein [Cronobacter malonaticus]EKK7717683.1 host-nuclease inhibitor protein [Cronobacter sakazakii]MDT3559030.1 host-nuclease inhibitor Gam family protein [Cronobacter malonaticus]
MNAYFMHDRIEERAWQDHYIQIAREEEEAELADLYDRQIKFHHLHVLLSNTQADKAALTATFDDVHFQEKTAEFLRYAAETLAAKQTAINMDLRRG